MPTAMKPKLKIDTANIATADPIAVPTIWPKPSLSDLCSEMRILSTQTIAATNPPL